MKRTPVSSPQNIWFDSENVDDANLTLEQDYNNNIQSGIINNHFGSGVLPETLVPFVLFDSSSTSGFADGKALNAQAQPRDNNFGTQLLVELTGSKAAGRRTVKLLVIGLDFENNIQYDRFTFDRNEKQISAKHYKIILTVLVNDMSGTAAQSFNLGGTITIQEAGSLSLSRDCISASQDIEPNLFFRDFFVSSGGTLSNVLAAALPSYNIDALNIKTGYKQLRSLDEDDVSSQIGQKFLTTTNNIQKITLLMAVVNNTTPSNLVWTGDLIVSIYKLQSTLNCPTDIVPNLAIDFDPSNIPLAQLTLNYNSLKGVGVELNTVPQPVDFVFSNTPVGNGLVILPDNYYVIAVKRAGSADTCKVQFATGTNAEVDTRETLFNGTVWVDVPEESLWFQVYTDAAKISDGQAYDEGHGIQVPKTIINDDAITVDYSLDQIQFVRNELYYAVVQAETKLSGSVQDERTGNNVFSVQEYSPKVSLLNTSNLAILQNVANPIVVGTISDKNTKSFNPTALTAKFHEYGMVGNELVIKVITDTTDGYRYDTDVIALLSEIVNNTLSGAKFIPNSNEPSIFYKIAKSEIITGKYGDLNGDGIVDASDVELATLLNNSDLNEMPTYSDYIAQTEDFVSEATLPWQIIDPITLVVQASGSDGILTVNPVDGTLANFESATANFNSITNIGNYKLFITSATNGGNKGKFIISSLVDNNNLSIRKIIFTSDVILQIMRGDITNDMILADDDIALINDFVNKVSPIPATTSPANNIGKDFSAIRFTLERYVDRFDDYPAISSTRNASIHIVPDIYIDGYANFESQDLKNVPLSFTINKNLVWNASSIVSVSNPRLVPAAFTSQTGFTETSCTQTTVVADVYPKAAQFDPGKNDFFIPNDLIINGNGQIVRQDGYFMKMDFEIGSVVIELPEVPFDAEHTINILTDFIADYTNDGFTRLGHPAMRFADCSFVDLDGLLKNQIRLGVAVQSFSPQLEGLDPDCLTGIIVDGKIGVSVDYTTGLLTLNFTNLYKDPVKQTLNTKIQITVYLKKAGWNNNNIYVGPTETQNIFEVPTPAPSMIVC